MTVRKKDKIIRIYQSPGLDFYSPDTSVLHELSFFESGVSAGFPSPAEDYMEIKLDLNQVLIKHPSATFYVRVKGSSMKDAGIADGDILVVDKAIEAKNKDVVVCVLDGEFTVKRIRKNKDGLWLVPANPDFEPIKVSEESDFKVWGVVSFVIHKP